MNHREGQIDPRLQAALMAARNSDGLLNWETFSRLALYAPEVGYYTRPQPRVGRPGEAQPGDFSTASDLEPVFGQVLAAAAEKLLGETDAASHTWVELGAEPHRAILDGVSHPFAGAEVRRLGEDGEIPAKAIIFANELLDAQPFLRLVFHQGQWRERGLRREAESWKEVLLPSPTAQAEALIRRLPKEASEGYQFDYSLAAEELLRSLLKAPWEGLLLLVDYGLDWSNLCAERPQGTARGYRQHRMISDLTDLPGQTDLTTHVAWDQLEGILRESGLENIQTRRLAKFLMEEASECLQQLARDPQASGLRELLMPDFFGEKFQVLSAVRRG